MANELKWSSAKTIRAEFVAEETLDEFYTSFNEFFKSFTAATLAEDKEDPTVSQWRYNKKTYDAAKAAYIHLVSLLDKEPHQNDEKIKVVVRNCIAWELQFTGDEYTKFFADLPK